MSIIEETKDHRSKIKRGIIGEAKDKIRRSLSFTQVIN